MGSAVSFPCASLVIPPRSSRREGMETLPEQSGIGSFTARPLGALLGWDGAGWAPWAVLGGEGALGGVSHKAKALPIVAGWGNPLETWQCSSGGDNFCPKQRWSRHEELQRRSGKAPGPAPAAHPSRIWLWTTAGHWPPKSSPATAPGLSKGTAGMSPCKWISWDQGAVEPPLSLTGGTSGEEEKGNWRPQASGRPRWDRSDPVPAPGIPRSSWHTLICASHHLGVGKSPSCPSRQPLSLIPAARGHSVCEALAGSVSWLCNHRQRFLIPPPAALRGFAEQIQSEVKFPLKSSGWEGKLRYWQQQQRC